LVQRIRIELRLRILELSLRIRASSLCFLHEKWTGVKNRSLLIPLPSEIRESERECRIFVCLSLSRIMIVSSSLHLSSSPSPFLAEMTVKNHQKIKDLLLAFSYNPHIFYWRQPGLLVSNHSNKAPLLILNSSTLTLDSLPCLMQERNYNRNCLVFLFWDNRAPL
jgi:hypothetical protein